MKRSPRGWTAAALLLCGLVACGGGGGLGDGGGADLTASVFPRNFAVASPLGRGGLSPEPTTVEPLQFGDLSNFEAYAGAIAAILDGTVAPEDGFEPRAFLRRGKDADCYGPRLWYTDHPDLPTTSPSDNDGELPTGDVGLWFETEGDTPEACAAAQLNARMGGIEASVYGALTGLAAMAVVASDAVGGLPSAGSSTDVTAEMNAVGFVDTTVTSAVLSQDVDGRWSYTLEFEVVDGGPPIPVVVEMEHEEITNGFRGVLYYRFTDASGGFFGNCDAGLLETTPNGSVAYEVDGGSIRVQARSAIFCDGDTDGRNGADVLDPDDRATLSNPSGWGNNFDVFTGNFSTSGIGGSYTYSWQAGPGDAATRNLNVVVADDESSGSAFFGFGAEVMDLDATITQMHCLWAIQPSWGISRPTAALMQRQDFVLGPVVYQPTSSNITYAPTTTCNHGGGDSFGYSALSQPLSEVPIGAVTNDLVAIVDGDLNGTADAIDATDFAMPVAPTF